MNVNIPTVLVSVAISLVLLIAFPEWARSAVQKALPWAGEPTEQVQPKGD